MSKPVRVLYFINDLFGGGAQKGLVNLLEAGFFNDVELHIATIIRGDGCIEPELAPYIPATRLHMFSTAEKMRLKHLLWALIRYPLLLLKLRPRVTILSLPQANLVGRFWGHILPISRLFAFEHSIAYAKKSYALLLKLLSLSITGILTDTARTGTETTRYFLPFRKYRLLELPLYAGMVDPTHLKTSTTITPPLRLLIAGRLAEAKNHGSIFQALHTLKGKGLDFHLTIVGSGELETPLKRQVEQLDLASEITFLGYLTPWTAQCPKADIYLQPSLREGLCITVVEAMRHGMPVIASACGGMLDYGRNEENILFTETTPAAIAAAILKLASDDKLRATIAANAKADMDNRFGKDATQAKFNLARAGLGI